VTKALKNPALLLVIALPALAVLASFASLAVTLAHPDSELPEQYHWEGFQLDRDFSRAERASALGIRAELHNFGGAGACEITLTMRGTAPQSVKLMLAHATQSSLDQRLTLARTSAPSEASRGKASYATLCRAIPSAHWRLELTDASETWSIRGSVRGSLQQAHLDAASAEDD
jgi:hypothetical protein